MVATWGLANIASEDARAVAHTHEVIDTVALIRAETLQIELSTQSFRLTGDPAHITTRDAAIERREAALRGLRNLTTDNPTQQSSGKILQEVLAQRLAMARRIEVLRREEGQGAADLFAATAEIAETRALAQKVLNRIDAEERRLLDLRTAAQTMAKQMVVASGGLITLVLFALLVGTYVLLRRQLQEAAIGQRRINKHNEVLERRVNDRTAELRASREHLQDVINNVPALIAYVDAECRYVYANRQYRERFATGGTDIERRTVAQVLGPERYAIAAPIIERALQGETQSYDWEPFPGVWQAINYVPRRDASGTVEGYYVLGTDITERRRTGERIAVLNEDLRQRVSDLERVSRALRTLSAGNHAMLRATDEMTLLDSMCKAIVQAGGYDTAVVWFSEHDAAQSLRPMAQCGYPGGLDVLRTLPTTWADNPRGQGAAATAIRSGKSCLVRNVLKDARYAVWRKELPRDGSGIACPIQIDGETIGALAIYDAEPDTFSAEEQSLLEECTNDLAFGIRALRARVEQQRMQEAMHRLMHQDTLTGLPNEAQFTAYLWEAMKPGDNGVAGFALLQIDIQRLREINNSLGFDQGDHVLQESGRRLRLAMPTDAKMARLRADEFAVLLPVRDQESAALLAVRIEGLFGHPLRIDNLTLDVSVKVGIVLYPSQGTTPHELYRRADLAVHMAKRRAESYAFFDPACESDQKQQLGLAGELRRAIEDGELRLHVQPKVEMATKRLCGVEALVRWQHPVRGLLGAGEFIPLAEHTGLIKSLTAWMINKALALSTDWTREGCALPIAVNLSVQSLRDDAFAPMLGRLLAQSGVAPEMLELEITESSLMEDADHAMAVMCSLRSFGIALHIDDFGTGYSSLTYLQKLPVSCIKIDQSFIRGLCTDKDSAVIVRSTIELLHDLGRKSIAEGIETVEAWNELRRLGCDTAQGYYIARPMPAEDFARWAAEVFPAVLVDAH